MSKVYVVLITSSSGVTSIANYVFLSLRSAQEFCSKRADNPMKLSDCFYISDVYTYTIFTSTVKEDEKNILCFGGDTY